MGLGPSQCFVPFWQGKRKIHWDYFASGWTFVSTEWANVRVRLDYQVLSLWQRGWSLFVSSHCIWSFAIMMNFNQSKAFASGTRSGVFSLFPISSIILLSNSIFPSCSSWTLWSWRFNWWNHICCQLPWLYSASFRQNSVKECEDDAGSGSCEPNQGEEYFLLSVSMEESKLNLGMVHA